MKDNVYPVLDDFSLINSGIFYKLVSRLRMGGTSPKHLTKRFLLLVIITWLPLLVLALSQGLAFGNRVDIPFWKDFTTHARFLIILPLLIFAEGSFDFRLKELTLQFFKSGILDDKDFDRFDEIKKKVKKLSDSIWPDIIIVVIIMANLILRLVSAGVNQVNIWIFLPDSTTSSLSLAGIYLAVICGPLFQFILLRWLWRWIIWFSYFRKLARLPLKLSSAHPDLAGGLGFLGYPPGPFIQVVFALAILFSTAIAEYIYFQHEKLQIYYPLMVAFALLTILMNVMPLIVFVNPLVAQRRKGFFEYSSLIQEHHRLFDNKWLVTEHETVAPGIPDASSMADFNGTFEIVKNMKTLPFDIKIMVSSIAIAILPMLPLLAFEYNIVDLVIKVLKMLA
jgi:hypothetical protein